MSLTSAFAEHLSMLAVRGLDDAARQSAISLVLDGLAVAALGASEKSPSILADSAPVPDSGASASLIGRSRRAAPADAARINGAAMHVLDFEPMWNPANHSLSTTLPAALALAETSPIAHDAPLGERILSALAIGIEAQERLRLSSRQFEPGTLVFHPPGAVGPLGSAVACGLLMQLDIAQFGHAIAIAASRAGGVQANIGSMTKALHCGQAAASGLESAVLAARGFTADADALGDPRGYGKAFFGDGFTPEELIKDHGALQIVHPGPAYKLYPSQYGTHFVIRAALAARAAMPGNQTIERVVIHSPPMAYVDRPNPATGLAGKFSFQYTAAIALLDGDVTVASFTDARRFAPDVVDLLPRINIVPDMQRQGRFDAMTLAIDVEWRGGRTRGTCDGPPGIWGRPVSAEQLQAKASDCLSTALGADAAAEIIALVGRFPSLDCAGLARLMTCLAQPVRGAKAA
ncbi:MmgE/PrpD family protein [Bradyrhizobium sp. LHD-71]|uniref:MmgE/PrpD family protein n=1 Tax=Bradyrhizobium sp. LHD-71 TaxID=3072141 RepID=UPI00280E652B|nr:MmgE/PrpD family protein [Bradyrhizobium sp. LHD-71]MDQ8728278.1 MmgE/PrpD family protein [Bradyrhizobium sp. LHD-71]